MKPHSHWRRATAVPAALLLAGALSGCIVVPVGRHRHHRHAQAQAQAQAPVYSDGVSAGYGSTHSISDGGEAAVLAPPGPQVEVVTLAPGPGYFWIGGNWSWIGGRHQWVGGRWAAPRAGYRWAPHRWHQVGPGWRAEPGRWQRG